MLAIGVLCPCGVAAACLFIEVLLPSEVRDGRIDAAPEILKNHGCGVASRCVRAVSDGWKGRELDKLVMLVGANGLAGHQSDRIIVVPLSIRNGANRV